MSDYIRPLPGSLMILSIYAFDQNLANAFVVGMMLCPGYASKDVYDVMFLCADGSIVSQRWLLWNEKDDDYVIIHL